MDPEHGLTTDAPWSSVLVSARKALLEVLLPDYLRGRRWFSAKARTIAGVRIVQAVPFAPAPDQAPLAYLTFLQVQYAEGDKQTFVLPLAYAAGEDAAQIQETLRQAVVTPLQVKGEPPGVLYDATSGAGFAPALLDAIKQDRRFGDAEFEIHTWPTAMFAQIEATGEADRSPRVIQAEQSNTSIVFGRDFILKLFRRLEQGTSPDLEIGRFLTEQGFAHIPPLAGAVERTVADHEPLTLAILQGFVPNRGDAWSYTLKELDGYYGRVAGSAAPPAPATGRHLLDLVGAEPPAAVRDALQPYDESARLLGQRTAQLHVALAADQSNPAFAPEPFTMQYQRALYDSVQRLVNDAFGLLGSHVGALPDLTRPVAEDVIRRRSGIMAGVAPLLDRELAALRTRCHGDYHLGQVLYTGSDFVIIDFEGEPIRSLEERRQKHSPLKDVAGMLRSFHYAAYAALFSQEGSAGRAGKPPLDDRWADVWYQQISAGFLAEYLRVAEPGGFLPAARADLRVLLDAYLLEKAIYELVYELNNRPDWVRIPLQGIGALAH